MIKTTTEDIENSYMQDVELDLRFMVAMEFDASIPWENVKPNVVNVLKKINKSHFPCI